MTWTEEDYCRAMLPKVSRTFAACIGLLPDRLEFPVLVAYLLCRIADTIEDCPAMEPARKQALLQRWHDCLGEGGPDAAPVAAAFAAPADDEQRLAAEADRTLAAYRSLSARERAAIRPRVAEMCCGMAWFARAYPQARPGGLQALATLGDLDRYCYYVAGTVGHLLTALFDLHSHRITRRRRSRLTALATSFGLGLQLTNIIKDVADDRRRGWCFVPADVCRSMGLEPKHLLQPHSAPAARRVLAALIAKAEQHLRDALAFCRHLPHTQLRMRMFCLTPLYFAIRTLRRAERDPRLLDPDHKVKITRHEVYRTIACAWLAAPSNRLITIYFRHLARRTAGIRVTDAPAGG